MLLQHQNSGYLRCKARHRSEVLAEREYEQAAQAPNRGQHTLQVLKKRAAEIETEFDELIDWRQS